MKIHILKAFTNSLKGGNLAGVVLDGKGISDNKMQSIAKKMGFSETAFIVDSKNRTFHLRYFTPTNEIDVCGHATIASFSLMLQKKLIKTGNYKAKTKAGILNIEVSAKRIAMHQNKPKFMGEQNKKIIANSLNISEK